MTLYVSLKHSLTYIHDIHEGIQVRILETSRDRDVEIRHKLRDIGKDAIAVLNDLRVKYQLRKTCKNKRYLGDAKHTQHCMPSVGVCGILNIDLLKDWRGFSLR